MVRILLLLITVCLLGTRSLDDPLTSFFSAFPVAKTHRMEKHVPTYARNFLSAATIVLIGDEFTLSVTAFTAIWEELGASPITDEH